MTTRITIRGPEYNISSCDDGTLAHMDRALWLYDMGLNAPLQYDVVFLYDTDTKGNQHNKRHVRFYHYDFVDDSHAMLFKLTFGGSNE